MKKSIVLLGCATALARSAATAAEADLPIADFESENYGAWKVEGTAFGAKPAPGTLPGQTLRLRGQGEPGQFGGPAGHIDLHIELLPDPVFTVVHQHDLSFALALTPWETVLGAEVEVPTLDGPVLLTVPAGTRAGRQLRLKGRGLQQRHGGRGDLYATVHIEVPAAVTESERAHYQALAATSTFQPRAASHQPHSPQGEPA